MFTHVQISRLSYKKFRIFMESTLGDMFNVTNAGSRIVTYYLTLMASIEKVICYLQDETH